MLPLETLQTFEAFLTERALTFEATVIGGSALVLLGVVDRATRDCDVLDPELPGEIVQAAREFAAAERASGRPLDDEWLNNGPRSLINVLPDGWKDRLTVIREGSGLRLLTLGRGDLLRTKLFALCDRGTDLADCVALAPTADELASSVPWVKQQDTHPGWPAHVSSTLDDLGRRLGHGL